MSPLFFLVVLAYATLYAFAFTIPSFSSFSYISRYLSFNPTQLQQKPLQLETLTAWLEREENVALDKLLANIGPRGRNGRDAAPGSIIASPSREHPNYFYQWVRDAAITISTLVNLYTEDPFSNLSYGLSEILDQYASLQYKLQHTENPSGNFDNLEGLGEPKFEADGSPFISSWGRPQRDGPALRAIALMSYLRAYNASHPLLWTSDAAESWFSPLYKAELPANSIIKADLEYVSHFWNQTGFDLWEEVEGLHFFTAMVQYRALREGADLALAFGDAGAADWYKQQAGSLAGFIRRFWDQEKGHLVETLESDRSGLDCGLLLGSIHGFPSPELNHEPLYPPFSDEILVSLLAFILDQRNRFPINAAPPGTTEIPSPLSGTGLGRYPEDDYDGYGITPAGGNPWFLCTSSAAEIFYRTVSHLLASKTLTVTTLSLPFYSALLSSTSFVPQADKIYNSSDALFYEVIEQLKTTGDSFIEVMKNHADTDGALSEQFDRVTGFERGARDLTWSYGAFLQAVWARRDVV
ncbi:hypothetical protein GQ43DRAFT_418778 [Delitschia confertaspora ATCC 74209]|uniref:glucan 1,4-alpha-glucosidase n=1 Tax=Delitschia confertaspora ATCC 74209 TaxID=1513339 RepID=A0A9P4JKU1_9PLEO|nr:hypothetical protein GQ43DRAFT_418778 [Delitschia confertaspora ATCC 74209]